MLRQSASVKAAPMQPGCRKQSQLSRRHSVAKEGSLGVGVATAAEPLSPASLARGQWGSGRGEGTAGYRFGCLSCRGLASAAASRASLRCWRGHGGFGSTRCTGVWNSSWGSPAILGSAPRSLLGEAVRTVQKSAFPASASSNLKRRLVHLILIPRRVLDPLVLDPLCFSGAYLGTHRHDEPHVRDERHERSFAARLRGRSRLWNDLYFYLRAIRFVLTAQVPASHTRQSLAGRHGANDPKMARYALFKMATTSELTSSPGRAQANENKVPTILSYSRATRGLIQWGFPADQRTEQTDSDREIVDWFQVYLDDGLLSVSRERDPSNAPSSTAEVETWFEDFLRKVYEHVESRLGSELPVNKTWASCLVEFVFSVPTTWPPPTVERFRSVVSRAGYNKFPLPFHPDRADRGQRRPPSPPSASRTPSMFGENEIILVCDVGGGTCGPRRAVGRERRLRGHLAAAKLDVVQGLTVGSVKIDEAFEKLALEKIERANAAAPLGVELEDASWRMMKSREFQNAKCIHGSDDETLVFLVPIVGLNTAYVNEAHSISNGEMQFTPSELRALFDVQVNKLFEIIDRQLTSFQRVSPNASISHLVLSGGLGDSKYVKSRLERRYAFGLSTFPSARNIQVSVAPEAPVGGVPGHCPRPGAKVVERRWSSRMEMLAGELRDGLQNAVRLQ